MRELRVGIVGAGYIARVHSAAYCAIPGTFSDAPRTLALRAVADTAPQRAQALRSAWGWERVCTDWREVTQAVDVDLVDICVPNVFHAPIALDALLHGKHVICEKPLATDLESARAMCDAVSARDLIAQVCFYYRLWPAVSWAKELIRDGALGAIQHFRGWMLQDYAAVRNHDLGWRAQPEQAGSGALADLGSHVIDIARCLCGEISSVSAITRSLIDRPIGAPAVADLAGLLVEFESGASGMIEAGWAAHGHKTDLGFDVIGEAGAISFAWERGNEIQVLLNDDASPISGPRRILIGPGHPNATGFGGSPGQGLGYRDAFTIGIGQAACAIAREDKSVSPSFEDGLRAAEVVAAAAAAAESRTWKPIGDIRASSK